MKINGTLFQYFHWYFPNDGTLWNKLQKNAPDLADAGVTALWMPPAFKAFGGKNDVGYGTYDLYDLGEFQQKGSKRTKYGTKAQYLAAIKAAHTAQLQVYGDLVLNHKGGADETENIRAIRVRSDNRGVTMGEEVMIDAWTKFTFPGRKGKYSPFIWNWHHFDGIDWADNLKESSIFKIVDEGKDWDNGVDTTYGNYAYLMYADIDFQHPEVMAELKTWGEWYTKFTGVNGFRMDAIKHIRFNFFNEWLDHIRGKTGKELFTVGEYWNPDDIEMLHRYLAETGGRMSLFDAPLHKNFYTASRTPWGGFDMRRILDNTLMSQQPSLAVTLVENHDTQPLQALESTVDWWFKPLAYALILLRSEGYPCVFYADYYGAEYTDRGKDGNTHEILLAPVPNLHELMLARKRFAYGAQNSYFDDRNIIGWTREGDDRQPGSGVAVLMSNGSGGSKWMYAGLRHAGSLFIDYLKNSEGTVKINEHGWGLFRTAGGSVSAWVRAEESV